MQHVIFSSHLTDPQFIIMNEGKTTLMAAPKELAGVSNPTIYFLSKDELFVCGGRLMQENKVLEHGLSFSDKTLKFNLKSQSTTVLPSMINRREDFRIVQIKNELYAIGGVGSSKNQNDIFDLDSNVWKNFIPNDLDAFFTEAFILNGQVIAVANNLLMEELKAEKGSLIQFPYIDVHYILKPRLLTQIGGSLILVSSKKKIYCIDIEKRRILHLFSTKAKPVSLVYSNGKIEVVDREYTIYSYDLEKRGKKTEVKNKVNLPSISKDRRASASARHNQETGETKISLESKVEADSRFFLNGMPKPKLIEFKKNGSTAIHSLPLKEQHLYDSPILGQLSTQSKIMFYTQNRICNYETATENTNSKFLNSGFELNCQNVCLSKDRILFASISDFTPTQSSLIMIPVTGEMSSITINYESNIRSLLPFKDFVIAFAENNNTLCNNLINTTWSVCFPVELKDKIFYLTDLDGELLGIGPDGSISKAFLLDGIDNSEVIPFGKYEFSFTNLLNQISCANLISIGNTRIYALPIQEEGQKDKYFIFNGLKAYAFSNTEDLEKAFKVVELQIPKEDLEAVKYLLKKSNKGLMRYVFAF